MGLKYDSGRGFCVFGRNFANEDKPKIFEKVMGVTAINLMIYGVL